MLDITKGKKDVGVPHFKLRGGVGNKRGVRGPPDGQKRVG